MFFALVNCAAMRLLHKVREGNGLYCTEFLADKFDFLATHEYSTAHSVRPGVVVECRVPLVALQESGLHSRVNLIELYFSSQIRTLLFGFQVKSQRGHIRFRPNRYFSFFLGIISFSQWKRTNLCLSLSLLLLFGF